MRILEDSEGHFASIEAAGLGACLVKTQLGPELEEGLTEAREREKRRDGKGLGEGWKAGAGAGGPFFLSFFFQEGRLFGFLRCIGVLFGGFG